MTQPPDWRQRVYDGYISTGQAPTPTLDQFQQRAPYISAVIQTHFPANRQTRVLDLGCGHGTFLYFLKQAGYTRLEGVDISPEQVDNAHKLGISEVKQGDIVPFLHVCADQSFDVVIAMDILEHLTRPELFELLDEVYRVLAPGGKFFVHVPNAEGIYGARIRYADITHEQAFTPQSMQQILRTVRFVDVHSYEDQPIAHGVKSTLRRVIWSLGTLLPRLLMAAETGQTHFVLTQNMLTIASKSP